MVDVSEERVGQQHDSYGKSVLKIAAGRDCHCDGISIKTRYGKRRAQIDGTVGTTIAVEVESRTGKQVRGAILDLVLHAYPKKLMILIPKYIGRYQVSECEFILGRFIAAADFRVVLLDGTGHNPNLESDAVKVKTALRDLGFEGSLNPNSSQCAKRVCLDG